MKDKYDIFAEDCCYTPANTTCMGNPMTPTDTENGSEPLFAKCKKDNKKKCKKCVKEGLLSGQDSTLKNGDNNACIIDYINILAKSKRFERYDESDINDVIDYCLKYNVLVCNKPGEIVCDYSNFEKGEVGDRKSYKSYSLVCAASGIDINTKLLTKSIKKITFKNFDNEVCLDLFGNNDLSTVDLEFTEGNINITAMDNDAIVKFGKVNCNTLYVKDNFNKDIHPKGISLKTGSTIQILDLSKCYQLGLLIGKKLNIGSIALNPNFVEQAVRNSGFANQSTRAWVVNERY